MQSQFNQASDFLSGAEEALTNWRISDQSYDYSSPSQDSSPSLSDNSISAGILRGIAMESMGEDKFEKQYGASKLSKLLCWMRRL